MGVCVVGLGYIGLPTALMMASHGVDVVGVDYSDKVVSELNSGQLTFQEDGLQAVFDQALEAGIVFTKEYPKADMYIVAVPTPYDAGTKKIDASYVVNAVNSVLDVCDPGAIIVVESTISPGTIDSFVRPAATARGFVPGEDVHLVHAPERIIPGNMINELVYNNRTIGADSSAVAEQVKSVYQSFCEGSISITDIRTAEMSKVVENTFRDINIAYANELAKICRSAGMNVNEVIRIANCHPRVNILSPGPGVGGHCISVDPWFLVGDYPELANLIRQARHINDSMPEYVLGRVREIMTENGIDDPSRVGFYGLTYKENVDDIRESPTLQLAESMRRHLCGGAGMVKFYDPFVKDDVVPGQLHDLDSFLNAVDFVVVMVGHDEVRENEERLRGKIVLDTRQCLSEVPAERL